ncbi:DUF3939 domain-containing protein [Rubeoparvulum massiliense]|uniref:DUF3939 domain-containing protein n=1 Tax=Rubeoparvulum massiliense TaxID=1631346 RepID=UPI00069D8D97|nr:DUF3939 domain-containing protein [Rubeoparvulum massiliense]
MRWFRKKRDDEVQSTIEEPSQEVPQIDCTLSEVRKAIHQYYRDLPKGTNLSIIICDDNSIDYSLLIPYLHGIPRQTYFMSKATYELFEDGEIPRILDLVQKAVDRYIFERNELPIIDGDPYHKVSYLKLRDYLDERPSIDTYLTDQENMITHRKPR